MNVDLKGLQKIEDLYKGSNFSWEKLKYFYKEYKEKFKIIEELKEINSFFSFHIREINNLKNYSVELQYYLLYLYCRLLIYVSLHPYFGYLESAPEPIKLFLENFTIFKRIIKKLQPKEKRDPEKGYIISFFSDLNKEIMSELVLSYQNFLSVYFLSDTRNDLDILVFFMKCFKLVYLVNEKYKYVNYKEFYNDTINKSLDIKRDFDIYLKKLKKKMDLKEERFCLLTYSWLFDSASKGEVLYYYNVEKQRSEVFNELLNMQNYQNSSNFSLTFEVS